LQRVVAVFEFFVLLPERGNVALEGGGAFLVGVDELALAVEQRLEPLGVLAGAGGVLAAGIAAVSGRRDAFPAACPLLGGLALALPVNAFGGAAVVCSAVLRS
jgi:hypothetical protein